MRRSPTPPRRAGFTLVEILVVMAILAVLVGLLLPAITGAMRNARDATVSADINTLSQSLASFKEKYGDYPPSRIILSENGRYDVSSAAAQKMIVSVNGTGGTDLTYAQLAQKSISYLRKFWPRVVTSTSGYVWPASPGTTFYDFDGDGVFDNDTDATDGFYGTILEGDECLAFFLGGIPLNSTATATGPPKWSMSGFGKVPANPFSNNRNQTGLLMYNGNRTPPIHEFKNERLVDILSTRFPDGNGFPSYTDALATGRPYAYFSGWTGGYDPNDVNVVEPSPDGAASLTLRGFRVSFTVKTDAGVDTNIAISAAPNPYTSGPPNGATTTQWQKGQTFQIISAGRDGVYGLGGEYDAEGTVHLVLAPPAQSIPSGMSREGERDNLTNFASGPLE